MTNLSPKTNLTEAEKLRITIFSILDAKIKFADFQLRKFSKSILKENQKPNRANSTDEEVATIANEKVFSFIENSSLRTTKLLYLRANLNNWNSKKILYLLTQKMIQKMTLEEIKEEIK